MEKHLSNAAKKAKSRGSAFRKKRDERLRAAYYEGITASELAEVSGYAVGTIYNLCRELGLKLTRTEPKAAAPADTATAVDPEGWARRPWR